MTVAHDLEALADRMMAAIREMEGNLVNSRGETMPYFVDDYAVLHDYFDANIWDDPAIDDLPTNEWIALQDIVHRRLVERARTVKGYEKNMTHDPDVRYVKKYGCVFDVYAALIDDDSIMGMVRQSMISYLNRQGTITGDISLEIMPEAQQMAEGVSLDKRRIMASGYAIPHEKKEAPMEPTMNIVNQINAGLDDLRHTLVMMAQGDVASRITNEHKAKYQLELIVDMIDDNQAGKKIPWSDRKLLVEEEFS